MRNLVLIFFLSLGLASRGVAQSLPTALYPTSPDTVAAGSGDLVITVTGFGFEQGSIVQWNGSPRVTQYADPHTVTARITASDLAAPGESMISVVNPGTGISGLIPFVTGTALPSISFTSSQLTASEPGLLRVADLNRDGNLDLVWEGTASSEIAQIYLGNGDGTFAAPTVYSGAWPTVVIADVNGDGILDLVLGAYDEIGVMMGNGDGTFQPAILTVDEYMNSGSMAVGDFNGDGKLDVAKPETSTGTLHLFLGNGDGTFTEKGLTPGGQYAAAVVAGDYNGDGNLDLAEVSSSTGSAVMSVLLGDGQGGFSLGAQYAAGPSPVRMATADMNGDGIADLLVLNAGCGSQCGDGSLSVFLGNGDGTFQALPAYQLGVLPEDMVVQDVNGDNIPDVVVSDAGDVLVVLEFGSQGVPINPIYYLSVSAGYAVAAGDFNHDGLMDLALGTGTGPTDILMQAALQATPATLNFGVQAVGSKAKGPIQLQNTGDSAISFDPIFSIFGAGAASFTQTNNCPQTLSPGKNCTITVTSKPVSGGVQSAYVSPTAVQSPTANLAATGSYLGVTPASLNFGNQRVGTISQAKNVVLKNLGSGSIQLAQILVAGRDPSDFSSTTTCGKKLAGGASCRVVVKFGPKSKGPRTGNLTIHNNDPGGARQIGLSGNGN